MFFVYDAPFPGTFKKGPSKARRGAEGRPPGGKRPPLWDSSKNPFAPGKTQRAELKKGFFKRGGCFEIFCDKFLKKFKKKNKNSNPIRWVLGRTGFFKSIIWVGKNPGLLLSPWAP